MERYKKLKLLRGLYCLTQEEMARLAKCHRSVYSTAEAMKPNARKFTSDQATSIRNALRFEEDWFNDRSSSPLRGYRFASIDMDWSQRHLAVTENVRCRRLNDAEDVLKNYLPLMLNENMPVSVSVGRTESGKQLFFFLFDEQGLLFRTVPGLKITNIINDIVANVASQPAQVALTDNEFDQISALSVDSVHTFLKRCNVADNYWQMAKLEIEAAANNRFDYMNFFGEDVRKTTIKNICQEMISHGLTIDDIGSALDEFQQLTDNNKKSPGIEPGA